MAESLEYSKKFLISLTENDEVLYEKLGNIMSLLAFSNIEDCPDKELINMDMSLINKIEDDIILKILDFLIKNENIL